MQLGVRAQLGANGIRRLSAFGIRRLRHFRRRHALLLKSGGDFLPCAEAGAYRRIGQHLFEIHSALRCLAVALDAVSSYRVGKGARGPFLSQPSGAEEECGYQPGGNLIDQTRGKHHEFSWPVNFIKPEAPMKSPNGSETE